MKVEELIGQRKYVLSTVVDVVYALRAAVIAALSCRCGDGHSGDAGHDGNEAKSKHVDGVGRVMTLCGCFSGSRSAAYVLV